MIRKQLLGLALASLCLLGLPGNLRAALFTGSFDPANWELSPSSSTPGSFAFTGASSAETLEITANAVGTSETIVVLKSPYCPANAILHFNWGVTNNGNVGLPQVFYLVNGTPTELFGSSGAINGLNLPANTEIGFAISGDTEGGKNPAVFAITDWDVQLIPEAGTWLAGALGLGVAAGEVLRRRQRRTSPAEATGVAR